MPITRIAPARLRTRHAAEPRPQRERRALWVVQSLASAAQAAALVVALVWAVQGGAGSGAVGLVVAAGLLALAAGTRPAVRAVERFSRRAVIAGSQLASGTAVVLLWALAPSGIAAAVALSALAGACRAVFDAGSLAIVHHHTDDGRRRHALADLTHRHAFGHMAGVAVALPIAVLQAPGIACLLAAAAWITSGLVALALHPVLDEHSEDRPPIAATMGRGLAQLASDRRPLFATVIDLGAGMAAGAGAALAFPELARSLGVAHAALAVSVGILAVLASRSAVARLVRRRVSSAMGLGMAVIAVASVGITVADRFAEAALAYAALLVGAAVCGAAGRRVRVQHLDADLHAPVGLANGALSALAGAAGALTGGMLGAIVGVSGALVLLAAGSAFTALALAASAIVAAALSRA